MLIPQELQLSRLSYLFFLIIADVFGKSEILTLYL